jgi:hypothetical protein
MISTRPSRRIAAVAAALTLAVSAHAAPHGIFWVQGKKPAQTQAAGKVQYYGGPVISNAKVYAVFWGPDVDSETQAKIGPFFSNILDSTYMDWLAEYDTNVTAVDGRAGTGQTIGRGSYIGGATITPKNASSSLSDADIQAELDAQIAAGKLPKSDANTLYMVYFPSGVSISLDGQGSCSTFCAYHEGFKSPRDGAPIYYGVMPTCGFGCGSGFDGLTVVTSHETFEAITDPFPTPGTSPAYPQAWNDSQGNEIGDLCTDGSSTVTGADLTSAVQWEWSNVQGACNQGPWTHGSPAAAPASVAAPRPALLEALRAGPAAVFGR